MGNNREKIWANLLLLITAFLWGSSFAVRRIGLLYMPPFFFNSARFFVAFVFMLAIYLIRRKRRSKKEMDEVMAEGASLKEQLWAGCIVGFFYSVASTFQQMALVTMAAGETGFLTSLYIILVPLISWVFFKRKISVQVWIGAVMTILGLMLISAQNSFQVEAGSIYLLAGSVFYALQMIAIGHYMKNCDALFLVINQLFVGMVLNGALSLLFEDGIGIQSILDGLVPILYAGILSLGIANLLQFIAQKRLAPSTAAIMCSFESIFGLLTGMVLLGERMGVLQLAGCVLIFIAILVSQYEKRGEQI